MPAKRFNGQYAGMVDLFGGGGAPADTSDCMHLRRPVSAPQSGSP
jgi:hypothetical protein